MTNEYPEDVKKCVSCLMTSYISNLALLSSTKYQTLHVWLKCLFTGSVRLRLTMRVETKVFQTQGLTTGNIPTFQKGLMIGKSILQPAWGSGIKDQCTSAFWFFRFFVFLLLLAFKIIMMKLVVIIKSCIHVQVDWSWWLWKKMVLLPCYR